MKTFFLTCRNSLTRQQENIKHNLSEEKIKENEREEESLEYKICTSELED